MYFSSGYISALIAVFVVGIVTGGISTLRWSIAPDLVDQIDARSGKRMEGSIMAILTSTIKLSDATANLLFGGLLFWFDYSAAEPSGVASGWIFATAITLPMVIAAGAGAWLLRRPSPHFFRTHPVGSP